MNKFLHSVLFTTAICLSCTPVFGGGGTGGDEAGNGGSIGENNFVFAYLNLESSITLCLESHDCRLSGEEQKILTAIRQSLPQEFRNPKLLVFKSERREPGFFIIDGQMKIARTGLSVGGEIYINVDLLYRRDESGEIQALGIESATSILLHEMGHHQGILDHTSLDVLGSKVGRILAGRVGRVDLGPRRRNFRATLVDFDSETAFSRLLISDGVYQMDLSAKIRESMSCQGASTPLGGILYNLHWLSRTLEPEITLDADLALFCPGGTGPEEGWKLSVTLQTHLDEAGVLRLQPEQEPRVLQLNCATDPSACPNNFLPVAY